MEKENPLILITGGVRSGKSSFAEQLAQKAEGRVAYIATARVADAEMAARVHQHQKRRPASWATYELPCLSSQDIEKLASQYSVLLLDCLTILLSNLLWEDGNAAVAEEQLVFSGEKEAALRSSLADLAQACRNCPATVLVVTNEVGLGVVPVSAAGRLFRDWAGLANQIFAAQADQVYLMVAGIPVLIKG